MSNVLIGLHNVTSSQRLVEFVKTAFSFNIKSIVITRVSGTAAQSGIPEIGKIAFKEGKSLIILPDLKDAIEVIRPDSIFLISQSAEMEFNLKNIENKSLIYIVFSGSEGGFSRIEQSMGTLTKIPRLNREIPPVALLSIL
ncbi:RecB-family nuclease, partial [Acidianus sp. RZ1]